jgi:hypothetical protein
VALLGAVEVDVGVGEGAALLDGVDGEGLLAGGVVEDDVGAALDDDVPDELLAAGAADDVVARACGHQLHALAEDLAAGVGDVAEEGESAGYLNDVGNNFLIA